VHPKAIGRGLDQALGLTMELRAFLPFFFLFLRKTEKRNPSLSDHVNQHAFLRHVWHMRMQRPYTGQGAIAATFVLAFFCVRREKFSRVCLLSDYSREKKKRASGEYVRDQTRVLQTILYFLTRDHIYVVRLDVIKA
jgi:hypothetical protein